MATGHRLQLGTEVLNVGGVCSLRINGNSVQVLSMEPGCSVAFCPEANGLQVWRGSEAVLRVDFVHGMTYATALSNLSI